MENNTQETDGNKQTALNGMFVRFFKIMQGELLVRGIVFLILGLLLMFKPVGMLELLTRIAGIIILIDGTIMLINALNIEGSGRIFSVIGSIVIIILGTITILWPLGVDVFCIIMFGSWQVFSGIQYLCFTKNIHGAALISGILTLLTGVVMLCAPFVGLVAIPWLIGLLILISGIATLFVGWEMRSALQNN